MPPQMVMYVAPFCSCKILKAIHAGGAVMRIKYAAVE
jgi:hypothetical protein